MQDKDRFLGATSWDRAVLFKRVVEAGDIDELGHMNNAVYVRWLQDAGVAHWSGVVDGTPLAQNVIWVCRRHEIDYRAPLFEGETVEVRTWLGKISGPMFNRHVDIRREGQDKPAAEAVTTWLMLNRETGRPQRIGDDILSAFGITKAELASA